MRLPRWLHSRLLRWAFKTIDARGPDVEIPYLGCPDPYMRRWWVIPRNKLFNIYLHKVMRSDDDRALHDHPSWNISVILATGYDEVVPVDPSVPWAETKVIRRLPREVLFRRAKEAHRLLTLDAQAEGLFWPHCYTLWISGPKWRHWGFWLPNQWVPWEEFESAYGKVADLDQGNPHIGTL